MSCFTSAKERRLWLWVLATVVAIYASLGLAGTFARTLLPEQQRLVALIFFLLFVGTLLSSLWIMWRPGRLELAVAFGIIMVYLMVFVRMTINPLERTHLFEYGIVGILIYQALKERKQNGRKLPSPALLAFLATALLGWIDEGIQAILPNRVYDIRDVLFNSLAGLMAVLASIAMDWGKRRTLGARSKKSDDANPK